MSTYMARLGSFQFSIDTAAFQELQRSSDYRWQAKNRIGRKPAQQNTGLGADTIQLQGVIYPHYRGGLSQIEQLRAQAASGDPLPLIYTSQYAGQYLGQWCVTGIEETRTVFFDNGAPRKIEFSLSLVEYGEDAGAGAVAAPIASLVGSSIDAAGATATASALQSEASAVTTQAGALGALGNAVAAAQKVADTVTSAITAVTSSEPVRLARAVVQEVRNISTTVNAVRTAAGVLQAAGSNPLTIATALSSVASSTGSLSDALGSASRNLGLTAANYDGRSASSLHALDITSASASLSALAGASSSVKTAATTLRGFF